MRTVIVNGAGNVLILDPTIDDEGNVLLPPGSGVHTVEISDAEAAKFLLNDARFTVTANGTVVVENVPPAPPDPVVVEQEAAASDLQTQYTTAVTRLDQIIGAVSPTNAQRDAAIQDLARYMKVVARLLHAEFVNGVS